MKVRLIDGNKLIDKLHLIAACWSISPFVSKEKHNGAVDMLREVEREVKESTLISSNEPLTLEQLREIDGEPVWVEDVRHWALIDIGKGGQWDGVPFAIWAENGARFCYNILDRNLLCYRRPPEGETDEK